jgi:hypothetical protein
MRTVKCTVTVIPVITTVIPTFKRTNGSKISGTSTFTRTNGTIGRTGDATLAQRKHRAEGWLH